MVETNRRELLRSAAVVALQALVARNALALGLSRSPVADHAQEALGAVSPRERLLLDFGWQFLPGHASDPLRDLGFGASQGDFAKTRNFDFATEEFDASRWRSLNLPHDWAVELPFVRDEALQSHGYKPLGRRYPETSVGWYRRGFDIPATDSGRRIVLEFDGAFRSALVFVNGCFIGRNDNGYAPFRFDISDFVRYGARNTLVVRVDATFGDGWFYEGAGIYRHVWLTKTAGIHLGPWDSYVRTDVKPGATTLSLSTVVENEDLTDAHPTVHWKILDAEGRSGRHRSNRAATHSPRGEGHIHGHCPPALANLWSPESPYLYAAIVSVETADRVHDAERIAFGVRTLAFDPQKGFFLNGQSVKIKGTCNHQDHAGVGAALPDRLQAYRLSVLREMGCNAVRTSHNMPTPEWVAGCERIGMMMMCETRLMSSSPEGLANWRS